MQQKRKSFGAFSLLSGDSALGIYLSCQDCLEIVTRCLLIRTKLPNQMWSCDLYSLGTMTASTYKIANLARFTFMTTVRSTSTRRGSILKESNYPAVLTVPVPELTLENDEIAKKLLENRKVVDMANQDHEDERAKRLYTILRHSSKYKQLKVSRFLKIGRKGQLDK
jgi:hypothetical protein